MKNIKYLITIILVTFLSLNAFSQEDANLESVIIKGSIKDESGEPLIGANVYVKDSPGVGTVADIDGNFSMKVKKYNLLIISYMGYVSQEVVVGNKTTFKIVMQEDENKEIDEVVVTSSGIRKKESIAGAITSVTVDDLKMTPSSDLSNSLVGNVAGIVGLQGSGEPGANQTEFWVRGISTFGANSAALVLVDGFERTLNEINVEDIETFSVLKDASATAIYGSRGANGVVLITTKRGDEGKLKVDSKVEYGLKYRTRTPEFVDGVQYAELANEARITRNLAPIYSDEEIAIIDQQLDPDLYPNVDWMGLMLKDHTQQQRATVNLQGGSAVASYFVSASFYNEDGMYKVNDEFDEYNTNANFNRWNYRSNYDLNLTTTTKLKIGFSGWMEKQNLPGNDKPDQNDDGIQIGGGSVDINDDYDESNIWNALIGQNPISIPIMYSNGYVPAFGTGNRTSPWVTASMTGFRQEWTVKTEINATLEQDLKFITQGLRMLGRFGFDTRNFNRISRVRWPEQYKAERKRDEDGNMVFERISTESLLTQSAYSDGSRNMVAEAELHYNRTFNDTHGVSFMGMVSAREYTAALDVGSDIRNGIPRRNLSYSARASYSFKSRYVAEFNGGYTGSENFADGHRYGFFPSIAFAWNIQEESFIKDNVPWLSQAKIRYSYGEVGNDVTSTRFPYLGEIGDTDGYQYSDWYSSNSYSGLYESQVASNTLTWETAKKHNLGFDWNIFNSLFYGSFDIFDDITEDIYMQRSYLPYEIGVSSSPFANVGSVESKGYDGQFNFNRKFGDVDITLRGNVTYAKNEVLDYDEMDSAYPYTQTEGYRWGQQRGLIALGLFEDWDDIQNSPVQTYGDYMPGDIKYKDVNGDGIINDDDIAPIGPPRIPSLSYGAGISAQWKGIAVNIFFQGSGQSSYFLSGSSVYPFVDGEWGNILTDFANAGDRWISADISGDPSTENPNASLPRLSYGGNANNYRNSSYWLRDGSYLRLKNLEISYTIPKKITSKFKVNRLKVYFIGNNLATWDKLGVWDPEVASSSGRSYPPSKVYTFGININM